MIKPDFEFHWQAEYGVVSFGERNLASVVRYIHIQKQHHADGTLIAAMERTDEREFAWVRCVARLCPPDDKPSGYAYEDG